MLSFKNIAEPFRNMYTILQTLILVNLFLVFSTSFVGFFAFHNFGPKRAVSVVKLNGPTLCAFKLDSDSVLFHSVTIIWQLEPRVNLFFVVFLQHI